MNKKYKSVFSFILSIFRIIRLLLNSNFRFLRLIRTYSSTLLEYYYLSFETRELCQSVLSKTVQGNFGYSAKVQIGVELFRRCGILDANLHLYHPCPVPRCIVSADLMVATDLVSRRLHCRRWHHPSAAAA